MDIVLTALIYFAQIMQVVVIGQFLLGLALTFNVVNLQSDIVRAIWTAFNAILDPVLRPIRRIMPETGGIDFSPMVLLLGLSILIRILAGI